MNTQKRKDYAHVSVDSVKIGAVGDDTNGEINKIFSYLQDGLISENKFFKYFKRSKLHERKNPRQTHSIFLRHGMHIGCSSTSSKGQIYSDDLVPVWPGEIGDMALSAGSLQYEVGGISSYDSYKIRDHDDVIRFFQFLRQCFSVLQINELHVSFDILRGYEEMKVTCKNTEVKVGNFMNTTTFQYAEKTGLKVKSYNKSLKDLIYLPVSRFEVVLKKRCLSNFFNSIKEGRLVCEEELQKEVWSLSAWIKAKIEKDFHFENHRVCIREEDIYQQILLVCKHIYGFSASSNNKYTQLMNLTREQTNLWEASYKLHLLKDKLAVDDKDLFISPPSLNQIVKYVNCSKSTAMKIKKFLDSSRALIFADRQRESLLKESKLIAAEIEIEMSSLLTKAKNLREIEELTCTTLMQKNGIISDRLARVVTSSISSELKTGKNGIEEALNSIKNNVINNARIRWQMFKRSQSQRQIYI